MSDEQSASDRALRVQVLLSQKKSMGIALILTIFFGPLGVFYGSIIGGIVTLLLTVAATVITLGFGWFITWPICLIWVAVVVSRHNKSIDSQALAP